MSIIKNCTKARGWLLPRLHGTHLQTVIVLSLCLLVWMAPLLFEKKALFWGTPALQFIPWWHQAVQMLSSGSLPLWNPLVGMGAPLLANYQSALLYPPTWLLLVADFLGGPALSAYLLAPWLALHLIFSGVGMATLCGRLGLAAFPRIVATLAWAFSGYLTARINFPSIIVTAAWLPWLLWALMPLYRRDEPDGVSACNGNENHLFARKNLPAQRRCFVFLVFILWLLLLGGHAQTAWYSLLLAGAWSAYFAWHSVENIPLMPLPTALHTNSGNRPIRWTRLSAVMAAWLRLAAAFLLSAALAAPQLLPTAEYLMQSQRAAAVDYDLALSYSYWPWRLVTLLAPAFFGSPVQGDFWGYANYWENALYLGLLPLLLAFSAMFRTLMRRNRQPGGEAASPADWYERRGLTGFLFFVILVSFLWGLGRYTPVFPWLYRHMPTFDLFQAPARVLIWAQFCLALLAGMGAQIWRRPQKHTLYWTRLATAGALAVSAGAGLTYLLAGDISTSFVRSAALAGGWGVLAGVLSLSAPASLSLGTSPEGKMLQSPGVWQWAVVGVICLDLLLAAWGLNPGVSLEFYHPNQAAQFAEVQNGRIYLSSRDEERLMFEHFFRFKTFAPAEPWENLRRYLLPNLGLLQGSASLNNFDPLVPARYARWMETLGHLPEERQLAFLDWMGVSALEKIDPSAPEGVVFAPIQSGKRFYFVTCANPVQDEESALQAVTSVDFDPQRQVVLEMPQQTHTQVCDQAEQAAAVHLVALDPSGSDHYSVRLDVSRAGWLVAADTWYPGWQARLDGLQVPILRANYLLRAVAVEPGVHTIEFAYRPRSFSLGLWISLVGWLLFLTLIFAKRGSHETHTS